jgi:glycosyltransferase involved in cell wall biosynthesis
LKILYVSTISNTVNTFLIPHIRMLVELGHQVDLAFNIVQEVNPLLVELGCRVYNLGFERSPFKKQNYHAYNKLKQLIHAEEYNIVHTHTPTASAFVRLSCRKFRNITVIYTAHGFHFFNGAPVINWILYYPIERWLAKYTDILITINNEDYNRAKKSFKAGKVEYIPGIGVNIDKFEKNQTNKLIKRQELRIPEEAFVILSVGELNKNKNHETVIKAISKSNNPNIYYVICGEGTLENYLKNLSVDLGLGNRVRLMGFRNDIAEVYKAADIFAFPSLREGLSVALMEAMVAGLPVICSDIRGNSDLIENGINGYLLPRLDVQGYAKKINELYISRQKRELLGDNNREKISNYTLERIIGRMKQIYKVSVEGK